MVDAISIQPQAAETAGCGAGYSLVENETYGTGWYKLWRFTATAAQGWFFSHWIIGYTLIDEEPGGQGGVFTTTSSANPRDEEENYYDYSYIGPGWGISSKTITAVVAVFKPDHQPTYLILHSPTNNQILHGASGTILHDA